MKKLSVVAAMAMPPWDPSLLCCLCVHVCSDHTPEKDSALTLFNVSVHGGIWSLHASFCGQDMEIEIMNPDSKASVGTLEVILQMEPIPPTEEGTNQSMHDLQSLHCKTCERENNQFT